MVRRLLLGVLVVAACGGGAADDLSGEELFVEVGCQACHGPADTDVAPTLHGVWGTSVLLSDGRTVVANEDYVRQSIIEPQAEIVDGYDARMPEFPLTDDEVDRLVDYVRSIG